jgi:hypothetical protein
MKRVKNQSADFSYPKQINLGRSRVLRRQCDMGLFAGMRKDLRQPIDVCSQQRVTIYASRQSVTECIFSRPAFAVDRNRPPAFLCIPSIGGELSVRSHGESFRGFAKFAINNGR